MHHQRRKSGHASGNSSMTDVRKAVTASDLSYKPKQQPSTRPAAMTRRTSQGAQKLGKNPREREREWEEERWFDEERESFPQFCTSCEKQFTPSSHPALYCSDSCRLNDQQNAGASAPSSRSTTGHPSAPQYPFYSGPPEPRDIVPRASPSRPTSTHFSPPTTPASHTSAVSALKSLSIRPPSPTSPMGTYHSSIWSFGRSATTSPSTSYTRPVSNLFPSTYDGAYYTAAGYGTSSDRPLPSRRPGIYSRPKSIELVTPMIGR